MYVVQARRREILNAMHLLFYYITKWRFPQDDQWIIAL